MRRDLSWFANELQGVRPVSLAWMACHILLASPLDNPPFCDGCVLIGRRGDKDDDDDS